MTKTRSTATTAELASMFGVAPQSVSAWVRAGAPVLTRGGRGRGRSATFDLRAVAVWVISRPPPLNSDWTLAIHVELSHRAEAVLAELDRRR
jgi:hypothetical protein